MPYNDGVRIGGFRQTSYSDSHKEIAMTVSRLSAEDIHLIGSATKTKKDALDIYRDRMLSIKG